MATITAVRDTRTHWNGPIISSISEETSVFLYHNGPGVLDLCSRLCSRWRFNCLTPTCEGRRKESAKPLFTKQVVPLQHSRFANKSKIPRGTAAPGNHNQLEATSVFSPSRQALESPSPDISSVAVRSLNLIPAAAAFSYSSQKGKNPTKGHICFNYKLWQALFQKSRPEYI